MKNELQLTKSKLENFYLTELLIYESYNNRKLISEKVSKEVAEKFCNVYGFEIEKHEYQVMYDFAETNVDYMNTLSAITSMYNTFEQFLKVSLNLKNTNNSLEVKIDEVCNKYEYIVKDNSFYEIVEKYRMLNNSIKHGNINNNLIKKYPELINKDCDYKNYGTILENSFNITDNDIIECFTSLHSFVAEMYDYFETFGYIENE